MQIGQPYNPRKIFTGIFVPDGIIMHPDAKICFGRLCWFANDAGYCWPKQETLARSICASKRQTQRYIDELIRAGFIGVRQRGLNRSNVYVFLWHAALEGSLRAPISQNPKDWSNLSTPPNSEPNLAFLEWTDPSTPFKEGREVIEEKVRVCSVCAGTRTIIGITSVVRGQSQQGRVPCPNCNRKK